MLEIARLHWDGRIDLRKDPGLWLRSLLDQGLHEIPVTSEMSVLAGSLERRDGFHADPANQLITAAAILTGRRLVTSDRKILRWAEVAERQGEAGHQEVGSRQPGLARHAEQGTAALYPER